MANIDNWNELFTWIAMTLFIETGMNQHWPVIQWQQITIRRTTNSDNNKIKNGKQKQSNWAAQNIGPLIASDYEQMGKQTMKPSRSRD